MTYELHPRRQFAPYKYYVGISTFIAAQPGSSIARVKREKSAAG